MNKKLIVTLSVITSYVIICGLFIKFFTESHSFGIRFCSSDKKFSDQFLLTEFMESNASKLLQDDENYDYKKYMSVHRGRPFCGGLEYVSLETVVADQHYEQNTVSILNLADNRHD